MAVHVVPDDYFPQVKSNEKSRKKTPPSHNATHGTDNNTLASNLTSSSKRVKWVFFPFEPNETLEESIRSVTQLMNSGQLEEASRIAREAFTLDAVAINGTLISMSLNAMLNMILTPAYELFQHTLCVEGNTTWLGQSVGFLQCSLGFSGDSTNANEGGIFYFFGSLYRKIFARLWRDVLAVDDPWKLHAEVAALIVCMTFVALLWILNTRYRKYYKALEKHIVLIQEEDSIKSLRGNAFLLEELSLSVFDEPPSLSFVSFVDAMEPGGETGNVEKR